MSNDEQKEPLSAEEDRFSAFDEPVRPDEKKPKKKGRLSPRVRTLIYAAVAVVLLAVILLLVLWLPRFITPAESSGEPSSVDTVTYTVYDHSADTADIKVTAVQVQKGDTSYTVRYNEKDKVYRLDGYEDLTLDTTSVDSLVGAATTLIADDKIATVGDLADYGLAAPQATATITYADGKTAVLHIGNETPATGSYYCRVDGDENVYMIESGSVSAFLLDDYSFVSTTLFSAPTVKEGDNDGTPVIKKMVLTGKAHPQRLTIQRNGGNAEETLSYFTYLITEPYRRGTTQAAVDTLTAFTQLNATSAVILHPTAAQKAQFGFNDPYAVMDIIMAVETSSADESADATVVEYYNAFDVKITIGSRDADSGDYLVMIPGSDVIYLVSSATLSGVAEMQYSDIVSASLFLRNISEVSHIDVAFEGNSYRFDLAHTFDDTGSDVEMTVTCGGKTYDTEDFRTLYQLMMMLDRYGATDQQPTGTPALSMAIRGDNSENDFAADFYATGANIYTVRTTEGELFTVRASAVSNFIKQTKNYLNGETVLGM